MKVVVFKAHSILFPIFILAFYQPLFAQTTAQQSLPTALKLSILKKDKLLYQTVLTANSGDSLVSKTKKGLFKCSKKKIIDPTLLKSMVTADGSERLTVIQLEDTASINPKDLTNVKIRIEVNAKSSIRILASFADSSYVRSSSGGLCRLLLRKNSGGVDVGGGKTQQAVGLLPPLNFAFSNSHFNFFNS